jgi:hypothetical protein
MGGRSVTKDGRRATTFERCQLSGIDLARFYLEKSPQKYDNGGKMRETCGMYPVYMCKRTEGHGGVKGSGKACFHTPSEFHPVAPSTMGCLT